MPVYNKSRSFYSAGNVIRTLLFPPQEKQPHKIEWTVNSLFGRWHALDIPLKICALWLRLHKSEDSKHVMEIKSFKHLALNSHMPNKLLGKI